MPITIDGLSELSDMLKNESVRTAKRYLLKCAQPAAEVVLKALDETVPVETGRLEGGLGFQSSFTNGDQTTLLVRIGPAKPNYWGMFDEFGTIHQPAQHWMLRAWTGCQDKCLSVFGTELLARLADMEEK